MTNFWLELPKPFTVLAPMDDVTDNVFRKLINETARPNVFFTEFTNADGMVSSGRVIVARKLKFEPPQRPIVAQIWGNNPDTIYRAAKIIKEMGFDGIDINMGCPVREVIKKCAGAGLIGKYELAKAIIDAVKKGAHGIPISVKTRLGIGTNIAGEWATFLLKQNLDALTIHARTASQMSKVPADWNEVGKIVELKNQIAPKTLIIGNGDIKSFAEVLEKSRIYGVDGVMIGRGIFDNAWVFDPIDKGNHTQSEYLDLLIKHLDYFEKDNPDPVIIKKRYPALKKFFKMYIKEFNGASLLRQKLMETETITEARTIITGLKNSL